jgi:hypothetical protein
MRKLGASALVALAFVCLSACAGVRTSFSYSTTEPESLVLMTRPQVGGLMATHMELQRIDLSTGMPIGPSHTIFMMAENHLVVTDANGETIGTSLYAKARMEPGDCAVLQITDTVSRYNTIQMLCYDRAAPVVRVPANSIVVIEPMQVLESRAFMGRERSQTHRREGLLGNVREVLRGYPNIIGEPVVAEMIDVVGFEDSGSLNIVRDRCDSHTPFRSVWAEVQSTSAGANQPLGVIKNGEQPPAQ